MKNKPTPPLPADDVAAMMADSMAKMLVITAPILEATTGYVAQCREAGFNETAAELLGVQFHNMLVTMIITNLTKPGDTK